MSTTHALWHPDLYLSFSPSPSLSLPIFLCLSFCCVHEGSLLVVADGLTHANAEGAFPQWDGALAGFVPAVEKVLIFNIGSSPLPLILSGL